MADLETTSRRYQRLTRIAAGGMATVYLGRLRSAEGFRRLVAIKRPHKFVLTDPEMREAFLREAHLAAAIHHPNVVSVLDVDDSDNQLSLVLEYVDGVSLSTLTESGRLPLDIALQVIADAARGLHGAHVLTDELGNPLHLVHRDVSPHNILVGLDGVTKLTDFGIARASERQGVTRSDVLKGKASYMAPEYVKNRHLDARSDIFALGVVAWEVLTGERLFISDQILDTLRRVVSEEVPAPSAVSSDVPKVLDAIVEKALCRDPEARFQTAKDLATALSDAMRSLGLAPTVEQIGALVEERSGSELRARREALARNAEEPALGPGRAPDETTGPISQASERKRERVSQAPAGSTRAISHPRQAPPFASPPMAPPPLAAPPSTPPARPSTPPPLSSSVATAKPPPKKLLALIAASAVTAILCAAWLLSRHAPPPQPTSEPVVAQAPAPTPVASIQPLSPAQPVVSVEPTAPAPSAPTTAQVKPRPRYVPPARPKQPERKIDKAAPNPY
ncbi:MAG: protein kinase [Myxococcales bacterium]|nr:protein kinase [Myxococcales bacterium]